MDDEKLDLRDRLAIEILNGLLASNSDQASTARADLVYYLIPDSPSESGDPKHDRAVKTHDEQTALVATKRMERLIRSCYKLADIMRKVRLDAFR